MRPLFMALYGWRVFIGDLLGRQVLLAARRGDDPSRTGRPQE